MQSTTIEGWLTDAEGELLYSLAKRCCGAGVIVEIGSWKGKSTVCLARGSNAGSKTPVFAVDPNIPTEFQQNIVQAGVEHLVVPIIKTSEEASSNFIQPVELLFIDGDHQYESVKRDFDLWFPRLIESGTIVFHDSVLLPGVVRVVRDHVYFSRHFRRTGFVHSSTYAQKVFHNSFVDRIKNISMLFLKNLYARSTQIPIPTSLRSMLGKTARSLINRT